jgi:hypothetical protein
MDEVPSFHNIVEGILHIDDLLAILHQINRYWEERKLIRSEIAATLMPSIPYVLLILVIAHHPESNHKATFFHLTN